MTGQLTDFAKCNPAQLERQVAEQIARNKQRLAELITAAGAEDFVLDWDNSAGKLNDWSDELFEELFAVAGHLKSVCDNPQLRAAYNKCLPQISAYSTALKQNKDLYKLLKRLREHGELDAEQRQELDNYIRDCRLAGIELPPAQQKEFAELVARHSKLTAKFSENVLDSTDKWKKHLTDEGRLSGLPAPMLDKYRRDAKQAGKEGYLLGLDMPSYQAVMTYADDAELREEVQRAYTARASTVQELFAKMDNAPLINEIMLLRHQMAELLGFATPAEMLMATNMVRQPAEVESFLRDLLAKVVPAARAEAEELRQYVARHKSGFEAWDVAYYSEKLKQEKFNVDQEQLRAYFPLPRVLEGMFALAEQLFGIELQEQQDYPTWHKDVRLFKLARGEEEVGYLYCDLYAREHKNSGAWMNENRIRRRLSDGSVKLPAAYLVCNFRAPAGDSAGGSADTPPLLLHYDVQVLFHEFGHCLHHLLTKINQPGISGINGVPHDMVELPSQLLENWCWDKEFIKQISAHYKSGAPLPPQQLADLIAARNFHSGLMMLRQLEFSLFDILLHSKMSKQEFSSNPAAAQQCYDELRGKYNPLPQLAENRFPNAFSHIFAGGYAAGYYAYKWAEVMSADIYSMFEERGIYDKQSAALLRQNIFERGGLGDARQNFIAVRGREPDNQAFLRYNGIAS